MSVGSVHFWIDGRVLCFFNCDTFWGVFMAGSLSDLVGGCVVVRYIGSQ